MQPHPLQLPHYMLTFQGHEASQIYLFNSAVLVVALWLSRVLDLSCSKRWSTGCVASSRTRPLTPLVGKFSKSKVGPKKKFALHAPLLGRHASQVFRHAFLGLRLVVPPFDCKQCRLLLSFGFRHTLAVEVSHRCHQMSQSALVSRGKQVRVESENDNCFQTDCH